MSTETPKPRRRWLIPLLLLSLAANLFVIGVWGGNYLKKRNANQMIERGSVYRMLETNLPAQRSADIGKLRERLRHGRGDRRGRGMGEFIEALKADPFDRARLEAAQAANHARRDAQRATRDAAFADFFETLSLEERQMLAERFQKRGHKKGAQKPPPPR